MSATLSSEGNAEWWMTIPRGRIVFGSEMIPSRNDIPLNVPTSTKSRCRLVTIGFAV